MVAIGGQAGVRTEAVITDMDVPLGRAVGNALEIIECLDTLKGKGPAGVAEAVTHLASRMVVLAGQERQRGGRGPSGCRGVVVGRARSTHSRR